METKDQPIIAIKGLPGWTVKGRCSYGTFTTGPYPDAPKGCKYLIDMVPVYEGEDLAKSLSGILKRPNLDLALPDNNVRSLFKGCIGSEGSTDGHTWDNSLHSLKSTDSVGVEVYIKILLAAGGKLVTQE